MSATTGTINESGTHYQWQVHLTALSDDEGVRVVEVPEELVSPSEDANLDHVFHYGQNSFQWVKGKRSVSMGDLIELDPGVFFVVQSIGFKELTAEQVAEYKAMHPADRCWSKFVRPR